MKPYFVFFLLLLFSCTPTHHATPIKECGELAGSNSSVQLVGANCTACLRECSSVLDEGVNFYLKMRGVGAMVALREGVEGKK